MERQNIISRERTFVTIDLDAFCHNIQNIYNWISRGDDFHREKTIPQLIVVIKTDGYGHGAVRLAQKLEDDSFVWGYAVATVEEAMELRNAGMKKRILVLGYTFPSSYETLVKYRITPAVFDLESAEQLSAEAARQKQWIDIHIKVDTGMSRIGMPVCEESIAMVKQMASLEAVRIEGIFTHLARADEWDHTSALRQMELFLAFTENLKAQDIHIPLRHIANSAGIMELEQTRLELMRAGVMIYGLMPSDEVHQDVIPLKPILEWKSTVVYVKTLQAGVPVSYGGTYITSRDTVVATIPVGYGDGYPRQLSNQGCVLIRGKRAPVIGRVCMDQFMVDVTDIPGVVRGDMVTLVGWDEKEHISMEELAKRCGTINYEIACDINKRVPRIYQ